MFAYSEYKSFLKQAKNQVALFPLREWTGQAGVILRHDVDLDVRLAFDLAECERATDVRSTFFFLVTAETYNVCSGTNRKLLRAMHEAGFEIGLHFDPTVYPNSSSAQMEVDAGHECIVLEDIIGDRITSVSLHNPSVRGEYPLLKSYANAYDPKIFHPDIYLSDSRRFLRSSPEEFVLKGKERTVQLLLHPMHFSEDGSSYPVILHRFFSRSIGQVDAVFRELNATFARQCPEPLTSWLQAP